VRYSRALFQDNQQLVFNTQLGLSTAFASTVKVWMQDLNHLLKGFKGDSASTSESTSFEMFELFVNHNGLPP
jgi:hypothetical protein